MAIRKDSVIPAKKTVKPLATKTVEFASTARNATVVQDRISETRERAAKVASNRGTSAQERMGSIDYSSMDSASLLESMFSTAKSYSRMPDLLKPIYANKFQQVYNAYSSGISDPNSPLYNPYSVATNYKAIEGLAQYGYDATQMTDAELRELLKYKRTTATGYNAAAPTQSSSAAENAAYWAQEYLEANARTAAAESELAQMQRAVDYYANTLELSDSEIVRRINSSNEFPTLKKMMDEKALGSALILNRAVDYSGDDTIMGMIFSARNGGQTLGSYALNAGAYAAGFGTKYEADEEAIARRDASNAETYNPYAGGTTLENLGLRYGVASFDRNWLEQNKKLLNTDEADDYRKIKTAVENSEAAEKELAALQEWAQKQQEKGRTADEIRNKMADEDFWDDYKTLKKMEDARQDGTSIAMGKGVDYTQNGFFRYIDSLYPEPVVGEENGAFRISNYVEHGGDEGILRNEVERWLNGRGTTSAEGEAFVKEYGWLFGGETVSAPGISSETYDSRRFKPEKTGFLNMTTLRSTGIGDTAASLLEQAQEAAADGAISNETYVEFALSVAEQMEMAEDAGLSLEDYLANGEGSLPDISAVIEKGREQKKVRDEERAKAEALAVRTMIEEADAAVENGTATAEQRAMVDSIRKTDVSVAIADNPDIVADRQDKSAEIAKYVRTNLVGKLASVYGPATAYTGSVKEAEAMDNAAAFAGETAINIANIATGYFDEDYKRAALMGLDMETYYELYPDRAMSIEDAYQRAFESYTNTWAGVWSRIDRQAKQAALGAMMPPSQPLSAVLEESAKGDAAYDADQAHAAEPAEYGEGVGVMQTVRSAAAAGWNSAKYGVVNAVQYYVSSSNESAVEAANRASYSSPEEYRASLEQGIADINDPEERDAWKYLLDNYKGDIYKVAMNFEDERVKNAMRSIQQNAAEISTFMQENGSEAENIAFDIGTSAVSNAIYLGASGVLTALGVPGGLAAAMVYGSSGSADLGRRLEAAGLSENAAKGAALGYAALTGWLESSMIGEYIPNLASGKATSLAKRGLGWLLKKDAPVASKVLNWAVAMPVSEGVQEGLEYTAGAAYEGIFQSIAKGDIRKAIQETDKLFSRDELADNMFMGGLMAPLLGTVGAGLNTSANLASAAGKRMFRSAEKAMEIIEAGEATGDDIHEFLETLAEDVQDPEFIEQANAAATEMQRAETVVSALLRNDPETASAIAQKAQEQAKLRKAVGDAESALEKAQTQQAQYQELLDESTQQFLADASDQGKADYVREMTALVAEARRATERAQESLTTAREAAEGAELEMGQYQQQRIAEARREAKALVAQAEASADQMEQASFPADVPGAGADTEAAVDAEPLIEPIKGTPMSQRDIESIKDRKMRPIALDNPHVYSFFQMAAAILEEDLTMSTEGGRIPLGEDMREWTGWKRNTTDLIANLKDSSGMTWARLRAMVTAYANGDAAYIQKHQADAKRVELALDQMLAEGYTNMNKDRMEAWPDYRELMGYPPKAEVEYDVVDANGKPLFYHGKSKAAAEAVQGQVPVKGLESPVRVSNALAKALGVGKYTAPRGTEAHYDRIASLLRVDGLHHSDYLRYMHELGHALQDKIGMTATPEMVASGVFGDTQQEAFAEFFSVYMANRDTAMKYAGEDFVNDFEQTLRSKGFLKDIRKARTQTAMYFNATMDQRVSASIVNRSSTRRNGSVNPWRAFRTAFFRPSYAGKVIDRKAGTPALGLEKSIWYKAHHEKLADVCMYNHMVDSYGRRIGKSMAQVLDDHGIHTYKEMMQVVELWLERHAIDRLREGKPVFGENFTAEKLAAAWANAPQKHKDAIDELCSTWRTFTRAWLVDRGLMSEKQYNDLNAKYPYYVPTLRDLDGKLVDISEAGGAGVGGWHFHEAKGSDLDIINPLDSIPEMMQSVVKRVASEQVGQMFDRLYNSPEAEDMGIIAQKVEIPAQEAKTGDETLDSVWLSVPEGNTLVVTRNDGSRVAYQFTDELLYRVLTTSGSRDTGKLVRLFSNLGRWTRGVQALTTGNNPLWGGKNLVRDVQSSAVQGRYAMTPFDAIPKWLSTVGEIITGEGEAYDDFTQMGGGGTQYDTFTNKGRRGVRARLLKKYEGESIADQAALAGVKLFNTVTLSKLNEVLEVTTKVTDFKYAERGTYEDRVLAYLNAQNSTVDFVQRGTSPIVDVLKANIPFFNAGVQALGQSVDVVEALVDPNASKSEKANARRVLAKTALNAGIAAGIAQALYAIGFTDEEKEEFKKLPLNMRATQLFLPTRWIKAAFSDTPSDRMFIRVPLNQSPLFGLMYAGAYNVMADVAGADDTSLDLLATAQNIVFDSLPIDISGAFTEDGINVVDGLASALMSTTVGPYIGVAFNRNWYNSTIVPPYLEEKHETMQYDSDTPALFVAASEALYRMNIVVSPLALQYIAEQQTGFFGQVLIPFLSKNSSTGKIAGLSGVGKSIRNSWTLDARTSNDIMDDFYRHGEYLSDIVGADENSKFLPHIAMSANTDDARAAAKELLAEYKDATQKVRELTADINEVYSRVGIAPGERELEIADLRGQRRDVMDDFETEYRIFQNAYGGHTVWHEPAKYLAGIMSP